MTIELLEEKLKTKFGNEILKTEISFNDLTLVVGQEHLPQIAHYLRDDADLKFDLLLDIAAVDNLKRWPEGADNDEYDEDKRFEVVYIFNSTTYNHRIRLKIILPEDKPIAPSLTKMYGSANWGEREAFDLMGIHFAGHPNLKRILTHFKFTGHALRKDYAVNHEQWLDESEPMLDELMARLRERKIDVRLEDT